MRSRSRIKSTILGGLLTVAAFSSPVQGDQRVTLGWDPPADTSGVSGYIVHYGTSSGTYPNAINVGNVTTKTVSNLVNGVTYFFVVKSSNISGAESTPSNEISYTAPGINTPPSISAISDRVTTEDAPIPAILFQVVDSDSPITSVTLSASSSNQGLVPNANVVLDGSDANRRVTVTPLANQFGATTITITATDGAATGTRSFVLTVNSVNDAPTLAPINNLTIPTNAGPRTIPIFGIGSGAPNENQTLRVTATHNNAAVLSDVTVSYSSPDNSGSLIVTPSGGAVGSAVITVTVDDGGSANSTLSRNFTVVLAAPAAKHTTYLEAESGVLISPMVAAVDTNTFGGQCIYCKTNEQGSVLYEVNVPEGDDYVVWCRVYSVNNGTDSFYVTVDNETEDVYDTAQDTWANRWQWTRVNGRAGSQPLTVNPRIFSLSQGTHYLVFRGREQGTFLDALYVTNDRDFVPGASSGNTPPTLNAIGNLTINEDAGPQTINLTGISSGAANETQTVTMTTVSSNPSLIPNPTVNYTSPNATGVLTLTPAPQANGNATITVIVNDGQVLSNIVTRTFTVTVNAVNDPPTLNPINDITLNEDAGAQTISLSGITSGAPTENQTLSVAATSSNNGLVPNPTVTYTSPEATATLRFTPVPNSSGTATITVTVNDGQSPNNLTTRSFTITVNPINDPPTLNPISDLVINEDAAQQTISLSGITSGGADEGQTLNLTATSSNPALIPNPTVNYTSPQATAALTFTPRANSNGTATITVTVNDGQGQNNVVSRTFTVTVNSVNDSPTLDPINDLTINEDGGTQTINLSGITAGEPTENQTLSVTAISSNSGLVPDPTVIYSSPGPTATLRFAPALNSSGTATITVTVNDGQSQNNLTTRSFTVTVSPANDPPTLNPISDLIINEDAGQQSVSLSGINSGAAGEVQPLTVTATSSNPALIPNPAVNHTSPQATGVLTFTPVANANGAATITVTVDDGQSQNSTISRSFIVTVNPVNDPPTLNPVNDLAISEDAGILAITLSGITSGAADENQSLIVSATSSNPNLIPNPVVSYTSPESVAALNLAPILNANGVATITVTVSDGQSANALTTRSFTVVVNSVNDLPTLNSINSLTISENAAQQVLNLTGISSGAANETQPLSITATSSNPSLIPDPIVEYDSPAPTGTLKFRPMGNASGIATITVTVSDQGGSLSRSFTVVVTPLADPPNLNSINDVTLSEDAGQQVISLSGISPGGASQGHPLAVTATSSDPDLVPDPIVSYTSPNAAATLTFTPSPNAVGSAIITVNLDDTVAASTIASRSFVVTINPVNDPPTLGFIANLTLNEDAGPQMVTLTNLTAGPADEIQLLTITATSSNPDLVPDPTVSYTSPNPSGNLIVTPLPNANGTAIITVTVDDGQGQNNVVSGTFTVTVNSFNDPPTLNPLEDLTINEDAGTQTINLSGITSGETTDNRTLSVTATSSNPSLVPDPAVTYTSPDTTAILSFTPVLNASGSATITVIVNDGQNQNNFVTRSFTVTVNPINDPPTLNPISDLVIDEDTTQQTISLSGITPGAAGEAQVLTVTALSSNPALIPNPTVNYASAQATASLTFTPLANANGTATITVTVEDGGVSNNATTQSFLITVNPSNDPPTLNPINNLTLSQSAGPQTVVLSGISSGAANENQTLTVTATSSNPSFVPDPIVTYDSPSTTASLILAPSSEASGDATITVTVNDDGGVNNLVSRTFTVTFNSINDPPTLDVISNLSLNEDAGPQTVPLSGISSGAANESQQVAIIATSSDTSVIPNPIVHYTSPGTAGFLTFTPLPHASGIATIIVTVDDGGLRNNTLTRGFTVAVNAVNDPPTLAPIGNVTAPAEGGSQTILLTGISSGAPNEHQTLAVAAVSSNPALIPHPTVNYTSPNGTGSLTLTTQPSAETVVNIAVTVRDDANANNLVTRTFAVTIGSSNQPPIVTRISDQVAYANAPRTVGFAVGDEETPSTSLTISVSSSNPGLIPDEAIVVEGTGLSRSLTFYPVEDQTGTAVITLIVSDGTSSTTRSFMLTVLVNPDPVPSPLAVEVEGDGILTPNLNGQQLIPGKTYSMTAVPAPGQVFGEWGGDTNSRSAKLSFVMRRRLQLRVKFMPNPFLPVVGSYNGLLYEADEVRHHSSGFFSATVTSRGSFSSKMQLGGKSYPLAGKFDNQRRCFMTLNRPRTNALSINLSVDVTDGMAQMIGVVSDGFSIAQLLADRATFHSITNPAPFAGKYTMAIPGMRVGSDGPNGDGFGSLVVDTAGRLRLSGELADGTKISQSVPVSHKGEWPLYVSLYGGKGSILSWITFADRTTDQLSGLLNWTKPALLTTKYYPAGFIQESTVFGSTYRPPVGTTNRVLNWTTGSVQLEGGNLGAGFVNQVVLKPNNKIANTSSNRLDATITLSTGLFTGRAVNPATGKPVPFRGALLQSLELGTGYCTGTNQFGHVQLQMAP